MPDVRCGTICTVNIPRCLPSLFHNLSFIDADDEKESTNQIISRPTIMKPRSALHSMLGFLVLLSSADSFLTPAKPLRTLRSALQFSTYNDSGTTELLEALLLQADMAPLRTRQHEYAYQRRRLGEQLRLNKANNQKDYAYQRRRLGEQLRLEKKNYYDKLQQHAREEEIFHRKMLEQQLRPEKHNDVASGLLETTNSADNDSNSLNAKLEILRQEVDTSMQSPGLNSTSLVIYNESTTDKKTIFELLTNTHLPMPPREDASILSLCLAPVAHFLTAMFLLGVAAFYTIMAALDVLFNDTKTKTCLYEAGHVIKGCSIHAVESLSSENRAHFFSRIMNASRTFAIALWFITKCIILRAKHSKYANECLDAGTGSLRYGVFMVRSLNVVWQRLVDRLQGVSVGRTALKKLKGSKTNGSGWKRKLHLSNAFASIKSSRAKQYYRKQSLQIQQQRARLDKEYQDKLRALNQDRILLERERRALEEERSELICESMNLLAWCSTMGTKADNSVQKGWGSWWRAWD